MSSIIKVDTIKDTSDNTLLTTSSGNVSISNNLIVDTNTLYVDSTNNRVGIGTSSPATPLDIRQTNTGGTTGIRVYNSDNSNTTTQTASLFLAPDSRGNGALIYGLKENADFSTNAGRDVSLVFSPVLNNAQTEAMRIDSSGNLLVGKTSINATVVGGEIRATGALIGVTDGANVLQLNRKTSDGKIARFDKDGTEVGIIGSFGSEMVMGTGICGIRYNGDKVTPFNTTSYGNTDNTLDLGHPSIRWDDVYATNGTIQTSDQNEKQSIQSLTSSEIAVAQRISKLFKTFKWNSAVEEKGDSARTHTGIIAQDVQQAFSDEGLDAGNYALFISSTWWEKEISVDAVEAQDAVYETQTDEEGNETQVLVQEAIEGKDAYTYMDTKDEPTEGYTEKTRLGIRYPELLSFVSSAFEQRLTDIETRLTALET